MSLLKGSTYKIIYTNTGSITTEREITIQNQWSHYGYDYVRAFCWLKNESRTFRVDRISTAAPVIIDKAVRDSVTQPPVAKQPALPVHQQQANNTAVVYKRPKGAHPFLVFLSLMFIIIAFIIGIADDFSSTSSSTHKTHTQAERSKPKTSPVPAITEEWKSQITLRKNQYQLKTGFTHKALTELYASADLNYDNKVDWHEITSFQDRIYHSFRYIHNDTAINPVDFMVQGGGDCEDWSIFTCGFLKFWDFTAYVGVVDGGNNTGTSSHAIALFYNYIKPTDPSVISYNITDPDMYYGITMPTGFYLPIDYSHTGNLSNASAPLSPLRKVYIPEEIYGRYM